MIVKRGEIYYVEFVNTVGSEQGGSRPVLIIQNDVGNRYSPTVIGVPLTSKNKKYLPTHLNISTSDCPGLRVNSIAMFEQICTFDKTRIKSRVGSIPKEMESEMYEKIKLSVG